MEPNVVKMACKKQYTFDDLLSIMTMLRQPGGCPWDAEQTHASIRRNMLEEASEAAEAIDLGDDALLCEELGDVLLQVVFHATMAAEAETFTIGDVINGICRKLISRHPHVFGDVRVSDAGQVLDNWDAIKRASKGQDTLAEALASVSVALPSLMRLQKLLHKSAKAGLTPPEAAGWAGRLITLAAEANAADIDLETQGAAACRLVIEQVREM